MDKGFKQTGDLIKEARKNKKINQAGLAELVEVSQGYIADLENGKLSNPSRKKLYRIAEFLEIPLNTIRDSISNDEFFIFNKHIQINESPESYIANGNGGELTKKEKGLITRFRKLAPLSQDAVLNLIKSLEDISSNNEEE